MTLSEYAKKIEDTSSRATEPVAMTPRELALIAGALGTAGEAGEYAELIKKHIFHGHDIDLEKATLELGDVIWYLAFSANTLGIPIEEILEKNIEKLAKRYPSGFSQEDSKNREEYRDSTSKRILPSRYNRPGVADTKRIPCS
jgi:NTP pyrophosphatase (non-canonical NTP hydrolase)